MTTPDVPTGEMLSALFDGQPGSEIALRQLPNHLLHDLPSHLPSYSPAQALGASAQSDLHSNWNAYHLIGESLRNRPLNSQATGQLGADPAFLRRFNARLAAISVEQASPQLLPVVPSQVTLPPSIAANAAANDAQFRWKLVAGMASLAAVLAVTWGVVATPSATPQFAQSGAGFTAATTTPEGPMIRDPRLEELLSAHKQLGATTLQVPSGFVRNAGFDTPSQPRR